MEFHILIQLKVIEIEPNNELLFFIFRLPLPILHISQCAKKMK